MEFDLLNPDPRQEAAKHKLKKLILEFSTERTKPKLKNLSIAFSC